MMKTKKRIPALLLAILLAWLTLPTAAAWVSIKIDNFPIVVGDSKILLADADTRVVTVIKQDPTTKLITATVQAQNNGVGTDKLEIEGFGVEISFNGSVAPYAYNPLETTFDPAKLWFGEIRNGYLNGIVTIDPLDYLFTNYCNTLYSSGGYDFSYLGNECISSVAGYGGLISTRIASPDPTHLQSVVVQPGESVNIAEFYFMPVDGSSELSLEMFTFKYEYMIPGFYRFTNYIANGMYFVESVDENMPDSRYYIVSPNTFKMHVQRAKPNVSANNNAKTVTNYNSATMEWSYDGITYRSDVSPIINGGETIYVREKGDAEYSGNDALYGNYKKYIASEPAILVFDGNGSTTYIVTFYGNGGTPNQQTRNVLEGSAVGASNMPPVPSWDGHDFVEWNTKQDGTGTTFSATTVVNSNIQVYAQWIDSTKTSVEVTFDQNCDDATFNGATKKIVYVGEEYGTLPRDNGAWSITRPGGFGYRYELYGWDLFDGIGPINLVMENTVVTKTTDHYLYAKWQLINVFKVYTVTFDGNGGIPDVQICNVEEGKTVAAGGETQPDEDLKRADLATFVGWNTRRDGSGMVFQVSTTTVDDNKRVYAQYIPPIDCCTVTFDSNGGEPQTPQEVIVEKGLAVGDEMPANPTFTNRTFLGWNTEQDGSGTPFDETTPVSVNITVYAQWSDEPPEMCIVTFHGNQGIPETPVQRDVQKGSALGSAMPPDPASVDDRYEFWGWCTTPDGNVADFDAATAVNEDMDVYALWGERQIEKWIVTFDGNQGTPDIQTREVVDGNAIGNNYMPAQPTRSGYKFVRWDTKQDGTGTAFLASTTVSHDYTVYAQWEDDIPQPGKYRVTFDYNYAGSPPQYSIDVDANTSIGVDRMPAIPTTRTGYDFVRWDTIQDGTGSELTITTPVTSDITVYAQWIEMCTVTFDGNQGTPDDIQTRKVQKGSSIGNNNMPDPPTRSGYKFVRWDTKQDGTGFEFKATTTVEVDYTVYAQWDEDTTQKYTVTFNYNFAGGPNDEKVEVNSNLAMVGAANMPPLPTRSGYTFSEWNTSQYGNGTTFRATTVVEKDITVYAIWQTSGVVNPPPGGGGPTYYIVTFNNNDGTTGSTTRTVESGSIVGNSAMPTDPTRSGYIFTGWNTNSGGTGSPFTGATTVNANIVVYAQWATDNTVVPGFITDHIPYIFGYPDNTVRPDSAITRAEAAAIFFRLLSDSNKDAAMPAIFNDVAEGLWYTQAVNYLASIGIITGYPDRTFKPNQPITRAEFATIASRFDHLEVTESNAFSDVGNHWAKDYINSAAVKGWINGYPDGTFMPQQSITRAEVVKIVNTMLDRRVALEDIPPIGTPGIRQYSDIGEGHWAYTHIMEASTYHDFMKKADGNEIWTLK